MALTIKEVEHVALLARLSLSEDEKAKLSQQLGAILNYADTLNTIPTDNVEPLTHILSVHNVFRADEVQPSMPREEMLANAPLVEAGYYKVPKIM